MKAGPGQTLGMLLVFSGALIVAFSQKIVFPGLEVLLGIETIVGRESIQYLPDGAYVFTNPGAMMRWVMSVVAVGVGVAAFGVWLLWNASSRKTAS